MEKKTKKAVITLPKTFPVTHCHKGELTKFRDKMENGEKKHTIRSNYCWWQKKMESINSGRMYLSIREWSGKPYNSLQNEICRIHEIQLQKIVMIFPEDRYLPRIWIDEKEVFAHEVAKNEGLSFLNFIEWFHNESKSNKFDGVCIQFTNFKY